MFALFGGIGKEVENVISDGLKTYLVTFMGSVIKVLYDVGKFIAEAAFVIL